MAYPIWKDYDVTLSASGATSVEYKVVHELEGGDVTLFTGKAYQRPGQTAIAVKINDIVAGVTSPGYVSGISGTTIAISGRTIPSIGVYKRSGSNWTAVQTGIEFNPDWSYRSATGQTINAAPTLKTTCHRYQLVYVNSFGSWETFVIEGNTTQSDEVTRHTYSREYDNGQTYNRAKVDYCNELVHSYTFNTAFMNDAEAAEVPEILNSAQVYLYDAVEGSIRPLNITDTTTEYKTFKGNGNKLSQYTITAELAQDRIRR